MSTTIGPTPKNQTWRKRNQSSTFPTGFPNVFITFFRIFSHFFKCIFKTHVFTFFSRRIFKTHFFTCVHIFYIFVKQCEKMRFENALGKNVKKCVLKMENVNKIWKVWRNANKRQLKSSCFLATLFPFFLQIYFSCFLLNPILNYGIVNLNIRIPHKAYIHFQWSMPIGSQFTMNVFFKI